jgi:hypothetical protein
MTSGSKAQVNPVNNGGTFTQDVLNVLDSNIVSLYENNNVAASTSTPTQLAAQYNVVSATTNYQKVQLPNITQLGEYVYIDNSSAYILNVYPYGTQTIDGLGAGLPIQLAPSAYWLGVVEATGSSGTWASVIASMNGTSPIAVTYGNGTVTTSLSGSVPAANGGNGNTVGITASQFSIMPTGAVSETYTRYLIGNVTSTNTSAYLYGTPIYLTAGTVVNNINFITGTTAGSGLSTAWGGLFTLSGTTATLVATTAAQAISSLAANSVFTWALTGAYTVPATGLYYVAISITGTTMPSWVRTGATTETAFPAPYLGIATTSSAGSPGTPGTSTYTIALSGNQHYYYLT